MNKRLNVRSCVTLAVVIAIAAAAFASNAPQRIVSPVFAQQVLTIAAMPITLNQVQTTDFGLGSPAVTSSNMGTVRTGVLGTPSVTPWYVPNATVVKGVFTNSRLSNQIPSGCRRGYDPDTEHPGKCKMTLEVRQPDAPNQQ
jgi:hypothetical protein